VEGKVSLFDSNDIKIGETFARRARQLVKQQRASWINDSQDAIRFAPGMEKMDDVMDDVMDDHIHERHIAHGPDKDSGLLKLARRRVRARTAFKLHFALAMIINVFLVMVYLLTDRGGYFWPAWPMLGLGVTVVIHGAVYKIVNGDDMNDKVTAEYERLKFRERLESGYSFNDDM